MLGRALKDIRGNFSIMYAVSAMAIVVTVGGAVDYTNMVKQRTELATIVDATALAAATFAKDDNTERSEAAFEVFSENLALHTALQSPSTPSIEFNDATGEVTVTAQVAYKPSFVSALGFNNIPIASASTVSYAVEYVPPISIALALDTSGSMSWLTTDGDVKIDSLELATQELFDALFLAAENPGLLAQNLSTGFSTYNTNTVIEQPIIDGYEHIEDAMFSDPLFIADGGTDSTPSVQFAFDQLVAQRTAEPDDKWSGHIIFMTDGDNNELTADDLTLEICAQAKAEGFMIYTVAFAAPDRGKQLLETCASDATRAFDSSDSEKLLEAFELIGQEIGESVVRVKR